MTRYAKDYGPQLQQSTPTMFERPDLQQTMRPTHLSSPSRRHHLYDPVSDQLRPPQHSSTAATASSVVSVPTPPSSVQCVPSQSTDWNGRPSKKMPNWNEFYKNGLPQEVIVIEDTPEPSQNSNPTSNNTGVSVILGPPNPPSSSLNQATLDSSAKKRKIDHISAAQAPNGTYADTPAGRALQPTNSYLGTLLSGSPKTPPPDATGPNISQKRRRIHEPSAPEKRLETKLPEPADVGYFGLAGPVLRSKDVAIRATHNAVNYDRRKIADDDGHFIVVPEMRLCHQYQIRKLLGQGTFGKVVQAYDHRKNELVAVKVIRSVQKYRDAAKIELRVLQTLKQNDAENKYRCIHLRDCFDFFGHTCIVTDLLDSSLFDFLKGNGFVPFPNSHIQNFAKQLLTSVAFLHDLGLVHTDLKPENILLRDASYQSFTYNRMVPSSRTTSMRTARQRRVLYNTDIRLIDFGSATFQDEYHSSVVSTRHYRAPEIILGLGWSFPCDIWSIGCILVELFTGDALFQTHDNLEHLAMMEIVLDSRVDPDLVRQVNKMATRGNGASSYFKRLKLVYPTAETNKNSKKFVRSLKVLRDIIPTTTGGSTTNAFMHNFLDLLQKMFVYDPSRRITAKQALCHPWFQDRVRDDGTEATRLAAERAHMARQTQSERAQL